MDSRLEQSAGILRRAHQKYTSDLFSLEVEVDEGEEPLLRILRFEDGQIRDIMERRQPIIPDGLSPDDLRYAAFVFGMARAAVELAEQDDYHLWFDDLVSIDLLRRLRPRGGASVEKTWRIEPRGARGGVTT